VLLAAALAVVRMAVLAACTDAYAAAVSENAGIHTASLPDTLSTDPVSYTMRADKQADGDGGGWGVTMGVFAVGVAVAVRLLPTPTPWFTAAPPNTPHSILCEATRCTGGKEGNFTAWRTLKRKEKRTSLSSAWACPWAFSCPCSCSHASSPCAWPCPSSWPWHAQDAPLSAAPARCTGQVDH
jgi:hypothetical protein